MSDKDQELAQTGEDVEAWEGLRTSVMELEEGGRWRDAGEEASNLIKLTIRVETEGLGPGGQVLRGEEVRGGADGQDREGGLDALGQGGQVQREGEIHGGGNDQEREGGPDHDELPGLNIDELGQGGQAQRGDKVHGGADGQDREGGLDALGQ